MKADLRPICGEEWRDRKSPWTTLELDHICVRIPGHPLPHECSCGSQVRE